MTLLEGLLVLLLLFTLLLLWRGRFGKLDVVLYDFVCENDSLVGASNPGRFWFDFDRGHVELLEYLLLELGSDIWFFDVGQAEKQSSSNWCFQGENDFCEDRAQSVIDFEGDEFCLLLLFFGCVFVENVGFSLINDE